MESSLLTYHWGHMRGRGDLATPSSGGSAFIAEQFFVPSIVRLRCTCHSVAGVSSSSLGTKIETRVHLLLPGEERMTHANDVFERLWTYADSNWPFIPIFFIGPSRRGVSLRSIMWSMSSDQLEKSTTYVDFSEFCRTPMAVSISHSQRIT